MDSQLILTEREKTSKYISFLLESFSDKEVETRMENWTPSQRLLVSNLIKSLSETVYMRGLTMKTFVDGTVLFYSSVFGQKIYSAEDVRKWTVDTLANKLLDIWENFYMSVPVFTVAQLFFNYSHDYSVELIGGLPNFWIDNGTPVFSNDWDKVSNKSFFRNMGKFVKYYKSFISSGEFIEAEALLELDFGQLNKCFKDTSTDYLMENYIPAFPEVAYA